MKLYVTEYHSLAMTPGGVAIPAGLEPAQTEQAAIDFSDAASHQSAAFDAETNFVLIETDSICSLAFGANPTATTIHHRLAANETRFYGVQPGAGLKVAVISNT